jgi:hypothetical protein
MNMLPRPALHQILRSAAEQAGARIRLGVTVERIDQSDAGVHVVLSNDEAHCYDLVIGADGIRSKVRELVFGREFEPRFTGHGVWRYTTKRPANLTFQSMYMGVGVKAGLVPLTAATMYLLLVSNEPGNPGCPPTGSALLLRSDEVVQRDAGGCAVNCGAMASSTYRSKRSFFRCRGTKDGSS